MEIKNDVSTITNEPLTTKPTTISNSSSEEKSYNTIDSNFVDEVDLKESSAHFAKAVAVIKANDAITTLKSVSEKTEKFAEVVKSIGGLTELAVKPELTKNQKSILESESKALVEAANKIVQELKVSKIITVPEEAARIKVEQNLAKVLDAFLPEPPSSPNEINISTKEAILLTRGVVTKTKAQIEQLRESLQSEINNTVSFVKDKWEINSSSINTPTKIEDAFIAGQTLSSNIVDSPNVATSAILKS
jgi:hypothetical protein